jgi:hypothetical protein
MTIYIETDIPHVLESVYVASRPPTADELVEIATNIFRIAEDVMEQDPREWNNYAAMVGYQLGRACNYHRLTDKQYNDLVGLVMAELAVRTPVS